MENHRFHPSCKIRWNGERQARFVVYCIVVRKKKKKKKKESVVDFSHKKKQIWGPRERKSNEQKQQDAAAH